MRRTGDGCTIVISEHCELDLPVDLCLVDESPHTIRATVRGVKNGVFELCSPVYLRPGRELTLRHPERTIESLVAYCTRQESGTYAMGILMTRDADRRLQARTPVDVPATLRIAGSPMPIPIRLIDLSVSGLGIELPTAVALGASVYVELRDGTAIGEIRHCARCSDKFRAGIRMREFVVPPNTERVVIPHLSREPGSSPAIDALLRAVRERQSRYEAILFSLALPRPSDG